MSRRKDSSGSIGQTKQFPRFAEQRVWARSNRQWMGIYCSMTCLRRSMERLEQLDQKFRKQGIGTRLGGVGTATRTLGGQQQHGGRQ
jgi:hypothetical protein